MSFDVYLRPPPPQSIHVSLTILTTLFMCLCMLSAGSECENPHRCCRLQECWDLFQSAQENLGVRDDYYSRSSKPSAEELEVKCISLRTFHKCNRNTSRNCLGDLTFHSARKGVEKQMKQFNCSEEGPVYKPSDNPNHGQIPSSVCSFRGKNVHRHCGLFGDPHLRTFGDDFQTCKVQGAWPLIDNDYLTVQVTNDAVGNLDNSATATSKVCIHKQSSKGHTVEVVKHLAATKGGG